MKFFVAVLLLAACAAALAQDVGAAAQAETFLPNDAAHGNAQAAIFGRRQLKQTLSPHDQHVADVIQATIHPTITPFPQPVAAQIQNMENAFTTAVDVPVNALQAAGGK